MQLLEVGSRQGATGSTSLGGKAGKFRESRTLWVWAVWGLQKGP